MHRENFGARGPDLRKGRAGKRRPLHGSKWIPLFLSGTDQVDPSLFVCLCLCVCVSPPVPKGSLLHARIQKCRGCKQPIQSCQRRHWMCAGEIDPGRWINVPARDTTPLSPRYLLFPWWFSCYFPKPPPAAVPLSRRRVLQSRAKFCSRLN